MLFRRSVKLWITTAFGERILPDGPLDLGWSVFIAVSFPRVDFVKLQHQSFHLLYGVKWYVVLKEFVYVHQKTVVFGKPTRVTRGHTVIWQDCEFEVSLCVVSHVQEILMEFGPVTTDVENVEHYS